MTFECRRELLVGARGKVRVCESVIAMNQLCPWRRCRTRRFRTRVENHVTYLFVQRIVDARRRRRWRRAFFTQNRREIVRALLFATQNAVLLKGRVLRSSSLSKKVEPAAA
jgi:hypothetical protein